MADNDKNHNSNKETNTGQVDNENSVQTTIENEQYAPMRNDSSMTRGQRLWRDIKNSKQLYGMIAPYFLLFAIFTVFPVLFSVVMSFTDYNVLQSPGFVGLGNYIDLMLNDTLFLTAFQNTFILAVIVGPAGYMLSFLMAWILNEFPRGIRVLFTIILYAPSLAGTATSIFTLIFSSDSTGYLNAILLSWGVISSPILWLQDAQWMMIIIVIVNLWMSFGIGFLSFIAGMQNLDKSLLEAGQIDGVKNRWQELWYIVLPSLRPQLMFGAVMSISGSLSITGSGLTGFPSTGYATHSIIDHIQDYGLIRFELGYASAITVILFFLMVFTNLLVQRFISRVGE